MTTHASNEQRATKDLATLCGRHYARDTKASRAAIAALTGPLRSADGVTRDDHEPILFRFSDRVDCPSCISVVRHRVSLLQRGLGAVVRPTIDGCGDNGCACGSAEGGMRTNGGCSCEPRTIRAALQKWRRYAVELEARVSPVSAPSALDAMFRLVEKHERGQSTLCLAQSPSSGADDPPVTCSRDRGHDGQREGGCMGGTASWSGCGSCHACLDDFTKMTRMILCVTCGNKRCPRANDHNNECSGSNLPGQKGSAYE